MWRISIVCCATTERREYIDIMSHHEIKSLSKCRDMEKLEFHLIMTFFSSPKEAWNMQWEKLIKWLIHAHAGIFFSPSSIRKIWKIIVRFFLINDQHHLKMNQTKIKFQLFTWNSFVIFNQTSAFASLVSSCSLH